MEGWTGSIVATAKRGASQQELTDHHQAPDVLTHRSHCYKTERSHSSLKYLRILVYYRSDQRARLADRECKPGRAAELRLVYWFSHPAARHECDPRIAGEPCCMIAP
jgi:hypothetical protein